MRPFSCLCDKAVGAGFKPAQENRTADFIRRLRRKTQISADETADFATEIVGAIHESPQNSRFSRAKLV